MTAGIMELTFSLVLQLAYKFLIQLCKVNMEFVTVIVTRVEKTKHNVAKVIPT